MPWASRPPPVRRRADGKEAHVKTNIFVLLHIHAAQSGQLSQKASLSINKGGDSAPALDANALSVAHALSAPKPPAVVGTVDKTTVRSESNSLEWRSSHPPRRSFSGCPQQLLGPLDALAGTCVH